MTTSEPVPQYTQAQIDKLQQFSNEFQDIEQELFNERGGGLLQEDILLDFVRISAMCRALYMRVRMAQDDEF